MSTARERNIWNAEDIVANMRAAHQQGLDEGRTVSAEQIEEAAESIVDDPAAEHEKGAPPIWHLATEDVREISRTMARNAFRAAGLIVDD